MKRLSIGVIAGLCIALLFSFKVIVDLKDTSAEVNKVRGMAIFTDSTPMHEHEIIGEVAISDLTLKSHDYDVSRDNLISKARKNYPGADGIIIECVNKNNELYRATVIKFKK